MSTIRAILEPDADGSLHLPLPEELRHGKIEVVATLKPVLDKSKYAHIPKGFGGLKGSVKMSPDFDEPLEDFKEYME
jgi:hypothetical protein